MSENNPNNIYGIEQKRPLTPEEIEALKKHIAEQEKANEMLKALENQSRAPEPGVPFDAGRTDKLAEETAKILQFQPKAQPKNHDEIGLDPGELEELHRNPLEWINKAISNEKLDPNKAMLGLIEASEEENKKTA